jgi:hypothetical protein
MKKAVPFFLLLAPISYSGLLAVTDIREQQLWVLLIGAAIFLGLTHFNRVIGWALIYCVAHLALFQRPAYINNMVQIMAHLLIYDAVAKHYKGREYRWPVLAVLALNLVMAGLQFLKQDVFLHMDLQTPGLMTLPVYVGIYAAVTAPIIYAIHPALIVLSLAGLAVSKSSFAAVAFAAAMIFYLWKEKSRSLKPFLAAGLASLIWFVGFYDGPTGQFSRRVHIWKMVGSAIAVNPWGGWGIGSYDRHIRFVEIGNSEKWRRYAIYQPHKPEHIENLSETIFQVAQNEMGAEKAMELEKLDGLAQTVEWFRRNGSDIYFWQDPHNGYLLSWFEGGFPLLIFILAYIGYVVRKYTRAPRAGKETNSLFAGFIAMTIITGAHFALQIPRLSFTFVILLAILDRKNYKDQ